MATLKELEGEIRKINERNRLVEADKAWETSKTRKLIIAVFTYLSIAMYMWAIRIPMPFLNAVVPTVAFVLSTLTLPTFKRLWIKKHRKE
jgi:hypothetical protein